MMSLRCARHERSWLALSLFDGVRSCSGELARKKANAHLRALWSWVEAAWVECFSFCGILKTGSVEGQIDKGKNPKWKDVLVMRPQVVGKAFDDLQPQQIKQLNAQVIRFVSKMLYKQLTLPETEIFPSQRHVGRVKLLFRGLCASACRQRTLHMIHPQRLHCSKRKQLEIFKKNWLKKASSAGLNQSVFLLPRRKNRWCCCLFLHLLNAAETVQAVLGMDRAKRSRVCVCVCVCVCFQSVSHLEKQQRHSHFSCWHMMERKISCQTR